MSNLSEGMTGFIYTTFGNVENVLYLSSMKKTKYPGYFVNEMGEVFSNKQGSLKKLKPNTQGNRGYALVFFYTPNGKKGELVHRLVATAYVENPNGYDIVNHKDGNILNNNSYNLEWTTSKGNTMHAIENNLRPNPQGETNPNAKLSTKDVDTIFYLRNELKWTQQRIADEMNVTKGHINNILKKRLWRNMNG
jgi:hypothetical protein